MNSIFYYLLRENSTCNNTLPNEVGQVAGYGTNVRFLIFNCQSDYALLILLGEAMGGGPRKLLPFSDQSSEIKFTCRNKRLFDFLGFLSNTFNSS
jgi:hypothetical protein